MGIGSRVLPPLIVLLKRFLHVPQLSFGLILGGLFMTVVGAEHMGLHGSLGALCWCRLVEAAVSRAAGHHPRHEKHCRGLFVPLSSPRPGYI